MRGEIVDADGHVVEQDARIRPYLDEPFRSHPDITSLPFFPSLDGWHRAARRIADGKGKRIPAPDARAWLAFLDEAGVAATVLYPTHGLAFGLIKDREWAAVLARAYNTWLAEEFLKADPRRLKGVALVPLQDVDEAVRELRRAVGELGMVGAVLPAVGLRRPLGDPYYDPFYAEAQALGCMLAVHGGPAQQLGFDFFERLVEARTLSHPFAQMIQLTSLVLSGTLERFPALRVAFMEAGAGWVPFLLERLDREWRSRASPLRQPPSALLRSDRIFFHCELDEAMLPAAVETLGADRFVCASDFPHEPPHEFVEALEAFQARPDLPAAAKRKILSDNPRRLYRL
ncbi:MAG TPA: amidohydrolase family protein, partial [Thermodesulfobacteriota bacterium]|nr:amidohydrolase family protein [Thermodesulfobacteriota bacterium]